MIKRIGFDVILFGSLFLWPWYVTVLIGVLGALLFKKFWEIILAGFLIDIFYSQWGLFTALGLGFMLIANLLKTKIRFLSK